MPSYTIDENHVKIPAAWLIDQAGWKGKTLGEYGVHKNQALVLVNYSTAKGEDIFQLSTTIINDIYDRYTIMLEREVNIIG
jgi:UDP-N-acetylmuramate dehydrogenase